MRLRPWTRVRICLKLRSRVLLEGLWVVRFLSPTADEIDLLSGVVVIETGRILGGDSGYLYIGQVHEKVGQAWPVTVQLKKHDERIEGFFNDADEYELKGQIIPADEPDGEMRLELGQGNTPEMLLSMKKAADLP